MKRILLALAFLLCASQARAALTDNLMGYWAMNEASGNALDSHSTNHLTETDGTIASTTGKVGNARDFEAGDTEYFAIADNAALSAGNIDFTLAAWIQFETIVDTANQGIIGKVDATSSLEYEIYFFGTSGASTDRFFFRVCSGAGFANYTEVMANTAALAPATWYFVVAWHDATANTINIQVNNGTVFSAAYTFGSYDSALPFRIGWNGVDPYFDGLIDESAFWKRTLTTDERTFLYNGGNGRAYADLAVAGKLRSRSIITQ